jgi:hypothetical protein
MKAARLVSAPERGRAATTSRVPTGPELVAEAWHVAEDLPLFLTSPLFRRWHLHWGATPAEVSAPMPGDDLVPGAQYRTTRAITVAAPACQVWPWLVQVGCLRAGFYSNDLLDNLAHPSASTIVPELQHLEAGQLIPMSPAGRAPERTAFRVHSYQVNQWLLWSKPDSTWAWSLTPAEDGGTRLVTRIRARYDWKQPLAGLSALVLMEFGDFAMLRRMLRGIKARAEAGPIRPEEASGVRTGRPALMRHGERLYRRLAEDADDVAPSSLRAGPGPGPRSDGRSPSLRRLADAGRNLRNWGATAAEQQMNLPGDEFVPDPADVITRAVTINAPAEVAWRWLIQIGQNRGGMYSYDWLENLLGLRIRSAREIRAEWQQLAVGDQICLVRPGWLGLKAGFSLPVARIDPGRAIVLRAQPPAQPWDAIWSFHLLPAGSGHCRLLSRSRGARQHGPARVAGYAMDPVTLWMTRKMLLGIKERAEATARSAGDLGKPA